MDYLYLDAGGHLWPAVLDARSLVKEGRVSVGAFCVFSPMPSYRSGVRIISDKAKLKPHQAAKVKK